MNDMELTNFRDLGGLVGFEGKKLKEKVILRAAQPVDLVESDVTELKDRYELAHIVDFRGEHEVATQPVDTVLGADYLNIDILATHMKKQQKAPSFDEMVKNLKPGAADVFMSEIYVDLVVSEDAKVGYRQFIDTLLNSKGALLFHCYAGKDRTGWGAAIILKILDVSDEDIMTDYLATIEGRQAENAKMIEAQRKEGLNQAQLDAFEEMMSVKPLYLEVAYNTVEKAYGTFDNYLKEALNVTSEETAKLRKLYLV
jgi:protein-tyrosine phosphatase